MSFTRTRRALAAFDASEALFDTVASDADIATATDASEAARDELGRAFAADTADLNHEDTARSVANCPKGIAFIRRIVNP